jgi:DNA-binding CsgD family transcriptional regulator
MAGTVESEILGRDEELDRLGRFVEAESGALVVEGEAGIGKTTLWRWAAERAAAGGQRVLVCRPNGAEAGLSYAALGDLLGGALDDALPVLPPPQRRALAVALLLEEPDGPPPDARAIGVAVQGALRALAADGPVLLAIDDVQWLDGATGAALDFALDRLGGEPVATLAARRLGLAGPLELAGAERIGVGPLSIGATHRLLTSRLGASLSRPVLVRLHETSGGNPFYALELGRAQLRRGAEPGAPAALPDDLAGLVRERIAGLHGRAAAAAALLASPTVEDVVRACGGDRGGLDEAVAAGVLELDGDRVRFTHPLLAAGVEASMWPPDRRALHGRLAAILVDPEERARHLALAADGPDAGVAAALEEAARFAAARGATAAAAELAALAVRSTPATDVDVLRRRRIAAAELHLRAGDLSAARNLLEAALAGATGADRARVLFRLAQTSGDPTALDSLDEALAAASDDRLRAEVELDRVGWLHIVGGLAAARPGARVAVVAARRAGDPILLASAVSTLAVMDVMAGEPVDLEALRQAVVTEATDPAWPQAAYPPSVVLGMSLQFADRLDEARDVLEASVARSLARGDESARHQALLHLSETESRAGRYDRAAAIADEAVASAEQTGYEQPTGAVLYVKALADTYRGRVGSARAAATAGLAIAERIGDLPFALQHRGGLGFLELSLGDVAAADALLRPLWPQIGAAGYGDPSVLPVLPNAIEAMVRLGEREQAQLQLAELERHGARLGSPWSLSQAARCRALLAADPDEAEDWFERAFAEHERMPGPFERGRTLLARGRVRRRARRRAAARESLLAALAIFEELGTPLWAAQARAELARLAGRSAGGGLTETERRVADLAACGLTTSEVAAALAVSPKTVEGHLSRIYAKLGVRSRTQLAGRLP